MQNKNRNNRAKISEETLRIVEDEFYNYNGEKIESTRMKPLIPNSKNLTIEIVNETTLQGAKRLSDSQKYKKIAVLNFASAKNAGGGFLGGSQAQEESLARNSLAFEKVFEFNYR